MTKLFSTALEAIDLPLIQLFSRETEIQRALREATVQHVEHHHMMTTPEQVGFLAFMVKLIGARQAIEVGVFTGYGSLAIAQALPADGRLIACDHSDEWPSIGKSFWQEAGVIDKIDLHIAPAAETLQALLDEGVAGQFDFIFIDADKVHYSDYAALGHALLREGGLMVFDNVLRINQRPVVERGVPATRAVADLLAAMSEDDRYETTLIPIAEGMLLAQKRGYNK